MRKRSSSFRGTDSPNTFVAWAIDSPLRRPHDFTRGGDRIHDVLVSRASAEVPGNRGANLLFGRRVVELKEFEGGEDDTRRAEPALEPVVLLERFLDGMHSAVLAEALDRRDRVTVRLDRQHSAGLHRLTVQEDGARAAVACVTANMGARKPEIIAKEIDEQHARLGDTSVLLAVHGDGEDVAAVLAGRPRPLCPPDPSPRGHAHHLLVRSAAVSRARRVNTSIIARLYCCVSRRSVAGFASWAAILTASATAAGPARFPLSASSAPIARTGVEPTEASPIRIPDMFCSGSSPSCTATPTVAKSPVFRFSFS